MRTLMAIWRHIPLSWTPTLTTTRGNRVPTAQPIPLLLDVPLAGPHTRRRAQDIAAPGENPMREPGTCRWRPPTKRLWFAPPNWGIHKGEYVDGRGDFRPIRSGRRVRRGCGTAASARRRRNARCGHQAVPTERDHAVDDRRARGHPAADPRRDRPPGVAPERRVLVEWHAVLVLRAGDRVGDRRAPRELPRGGRDVHRHGRRVRGADQRVPRPSDRRGARRSRTPRHERHRSSGWQC